MLGIDTTVIICISVIALFVIGLLAIFFLSLINRSRNRAGGRLRPKPLLLGEAEAQQMNGNYAIALLKAYSAFEQVLKERTGATGPGTSFENIQQAVNKGLLRQEFVHDIHSIRVHRNKVAHEGAAVTKEQAQGALESMKRVISSLGYQVS